MGKAADAVVKRGLGGWWANRTEAEKAATLLLAFAVAIGPLGQGFLGAIGALFNNAIPNGKQFEGAVWLFVITAPLAAFVLPVVWLPGKHASVPVTLGVAGIASVAAAWLMANSGVPDSLSGIYCYADIDTGGIVYENECRDFNNAGFYAENAPRAGSPSASADIFSSAVAYTTDARGAVMAFAGILGSIGLGMIVREHS